MKLKGSGKRIAGPLAVVLLSFAAACAHDHALDRREVRAMENSTPVISVWPGPVEDPSGFRAVGGP
jgi:hypothetical protein